MAKDSGRDNGGGRESMGGGGNSSDGGGRDTFDGGRRGTGLPGSGAYSGYTQRGAIRRNGVIGGGMAESGGGNGINSNGIGTVDTDGAGGVRVVIPRSDVSSAYSGYSKSGLVRGTSLSGDVPSGVAYTPDFSASLASKMRASQQRQRTAAGNNTVGGSAVGGSAVGGASSDMPLPRKTAADILADRLADVLDRENTLYRDAASISEKKTDVIVHGKIEELDALVKAEQAIILMIGKLEDEREAIIGELSDELEYDLSSATLSDISALLCADSFERLGNCQKALASTLGSLKNTNETNAQLIQNALDYINFSVNLMTSDQGAGNVYSPEGDDGGVPARRNLFDVKL